MVLWHYQLLGETLVVRVKDKLDERAISRAFEHSDLAEACERAEADGALECDDRGTDVGRSEALDSKWGASGTSVVPSPVPSRFGIKPAPMSHVPTSSR